MSDFVVCIHGGPWRGRKGLRPPVPPEKGKVYTVIGRRPDRKTGMWMMVKLAEIKRGWFNARHFRPVDRDLQQLFRQTEEVT